MRSVYRDFITDYMKIRIGLAACGEGFGHVSRMVSLVQGLGTEFEIVLYAPDTVHGFLYEKLAPLRYGTLEIRDIPHLHLAKRGTRINYSRTLRENLPTLLSLRKSLARLRRQLQGDEISVLINDFEPFTALAATALGIPVLQINHPGIVTRSPSLMPDALFTRLIAHFMMPAYDRRLYISFYDGDLGPMIREEIVNQEPVQGDYYVVYLKPEYRRIVLGALHRLGMRNFHVFPQSRLDYARTLAGCRGVITSAGHQTLSEALYLGKPVFAIPQKGQYEQRLNAAKLAASGWGVHARSRNIPRQLFGFISRVESGGFPQAWALPWLRIYRENHTPRVIRRVRQFIYNSTSPRIIPVRSYIWDGFLSMESPEDVQGLVSRWQRWERLSYRATGGADVRMRGISGEVYPRA